MDINKEITKDPRFWAVAIPAVLFFWALITTIQMAYAHSALQRQQQITKTTLKDARYVIRVLKASGKDSLSSVQGRFDSISSAMRCAQAAHIPQSNFAYGETRAPDRQKDGSYLHRETYKISNVKLLQIARFIDYAENNFSNLRCSQVSISPARSNKKDAWNATVYFQYLERATPK